MKFLSIYPVQAGDHLVTPIEFTDITAESPALSVISDFRHHPPHTIAAHVPATEAAALMAEEKSDIKLVVNRDGELAGLITREHLSDQRIMMAQANYGLGHDEVRVADVMQPRDRIHAVDYQALEQAQVGDILQAMRDHGESCYLVLDRNRHHIRGVISSCELARRLDQPVQIQHRPHSLLETLSSMRD